MRTRAVVTAATVRRSTSAFCACADNNDMVWPKPPVVPLDAGYLNKRPIADLAIRFAFSQLLLVVRSPASSRMTVSGRSLLARSVFDLDHKPDVDRRQGHPLQSFCLPFLSSVRRFARQRCIPALQTITPGCCCWTGLRFPVSVKSVGLKQFTFRSLGHCDFFPTGQAFQTVC